VVVVAFFAVALLTFSHLVGGGTGGCSIPAPLPNLPAPLRALGGFDQSLDAGNPQALAEVASNAAGAVDPDLDGTIPLEPVAVSAMTSGQPAAVVVPLEAQQTAGAGTHIAGLVSFFVGCGSRAYFGSVADLSGIGSGTTLTFPAVSESSAAGTLDTPTPQLVYATSPFEPEWRNAQTGMTIPAGE
jgi:hypothetical protein